MSGVKGKSGGKRKGAGKKKGSVASYTLEAAGIRKYLIKKLLRSCKSKKEKIRVIDKLIELAEQGNMTAIREVLDRALGKAPESLDLTSGGEKIEKGSLLSIDLSKLDYGGLVKELSRLAEKTNTAKSRMREKSGY